MRCPDGVGATVGANSWLQQRRPRLRDVLDGRASRSGAARPALTEAEDALRERLRERLAQAIDDGGGSVQARVGLLPAAVSPQALAGAVEAALHASSSKREAYQPRAGALVRFARACAGSQAPGAVPPEFAAAAAALRGGKMEAGSESARLRAMWAEVAACVARGDAEGATGAVVALGDETASLTALAESGVGKALKAWAKGRLESPGEVAQTGRPGAAVPAAVSGAASVALGKWKARIARKDGRAA